jgi:hypothetical protein
LGFVFVWGGWLVAQSLNLIGEKKKHPELRDGCLRINKKKG